LDLDGAYAYECPNDLELRALSLNQVHLVSKDWVLAPNGQRLNEDVPYHSTEMAQVEICLA
jgi:hypothetical protein